MSISADHIIRVTPRVINAGSADLETNGMLLTKSALIPAGSPAMEFTLASDVAALFGAQSDEAKFAQQYFTGITNQQTSVKRLIVGRYIDVAVSAWLRGSPLDIESLPTLKTITNGTLTITIDGSEQTATAVDFSEATSFSDVATKLTAKLTGATVSFDSNLKAFTITTTATGATATIGYATGTVADALGFKESDGAVLSQGSGVKTAAENLDAICNITRNWVGFTTIWEIDDFEDAKAFADWADIDDDYVYCFWTRDVKCVNQLTQDSTIPAKLNGQYNCTACLYGGYDFAAAVLACGASINWDRAQGMKTWAFKSATGIEPIVNDESSANALEKIRCSYYGSFSARNSRFQFMYDGALCSTYYGYIDTLYGAIYIRSMIQRSCMDGLTQVNRAPFNSMGEAFIRAWMQDPINKAINNGSMDRGITLNASQKQQILTETQSETAASDIELNGYWARIDLSDASQRSQRHATTVALYWAYAGSVHKMDIEAVTVL